MAKFWITCASFQAGSSAFPSIVIGSSAQRHSITLEVSAALVRTIRPGTIVISANAVQRSKADALVNVVICEIVAAGAEALNTLFFEKNAVCDHLFHFR